MLQHASISTKWNHSAGSKIERELHYFPIHPLTVAVTLQPLIRDQGCSLPKVTRPNRPFRYGVTVVCSWKPAGLKDNYRSAGVKSPARSCSPHVLIAHHQVTIAVRENRTRWQPVSCQWKSIFKWKYMFSLASDWWGWGKIFARSNTAASFALSKIIKKAFQWHGSTVFRSLPVAK